MKTCILIPAAGKGKRFIREKYKTYKPFLKIHQKEMIQYVFDNFPKSMEKIIIVDKKIEKKYINILSKKKIKILKINFHNKGPAYSIFLAKKKLNLKQSFFVSYCDIVWNWNFLKIKKLISKDVNIIFSYKGFHPYTIKDNRYAFCKSNNQDKFISIREKTPYTKNWSNENLSIGCFFFKNGHKMMGAISEMINKKQTIIGEYYPSLIFNYLYKKKENVFIEPVNNFCHLGKPEYFEDFNKCFFFHQNKNKFISKINNKISNYLIMPCAGKSSRFAKQKFNIPKPFIKVENKLMYSRAIDFLPKSEKKIIILKSKDKKYVNNLKRNNLFMITNQTNGQAVTCYNLTKSLNENASVLIGACDTVSIWNQKNLKKLMNKNDILVWTCKNDYIFDQEPYAHTWVKTKNNIIQRIYVKKKPKNEKNLKILIGIFYFSNIKFFNRAYKMMINKKNKTNKEYYIDNLISECVLQGLCVKSFNVDYLISWGTPLEFKIYNFWKDFFLKFNY